MGGTAIGLALVTLPIVIIGWLVFSLRNRMFLGVLFCLTIYFLPFGVGLIRNKRAKLALFIVNLIAGWTAIIWIIALIWALIPRTGDTTVPVINSRD